MTAYVVAQLPFREKESAEDYQKFLFTQTGIDPVVREYLGNYVVVAVTEFEDMDQARALTRLLQELPWIDERYPEVVISQFLNDTNPLEVDSVAITVGVTPASREETEKEREYRKAYRLTEAFRIAQKRYQQSGEGRAAQRRYEQSEGGKIARKKYFQSNKYKASRKRYQEKRKMQAMDCTYCNEQIIDHLIQEHVIVENSRGLKVHENGHTAFVIYKEFLGAEWIDLELIKAEV